MQRRSTRRLLVLALSASLAAGCSDRDTGSLQPARPDPTVFDDGFPLGGDFQAFGDSDVTALEIDDTEFYAGTASLRVNVPPPGSYAGGALTTSFARDFSSYDALTFWAKSSVPSTLDVAGIGNDNSGASLYEANRKAIALTTDWQRHVIPIPLPAKLSRERGLFYFAEAPEGDEGHTVWFDEIRYANVPGVGDPRPAMNTRTVASIVGARLVPTGTRTIFDVEGTNRVVEHMPGYFTFLSSDGSVAVADASGIRVVGTGEAVITAKLGDIDVAGAITVNATAPPAVGPPAPPHDPADVISLLGNAYPPVAVDTWSADWDAAEVSDLEIDGNPIKVYTSLVFAGITFETSTIDASSMTHFHASVWIPEGNVFRIKLVDFGADGIFSPPPDGDDVQHELTFHPGTTPAVVPGTWMDFDLPLADFTNLVTTAHLAQLILSGDARTAYVGNVYFHR